MSRQDDRRRAGLRGEASRRATKAEERGGGDAQCDQNAIREQDARTVASALGSVERALDCCQIAAERGPRFHERCDGLGRDAMHAIGGAPFDPGRVQQDL